MFGSPNKKLSNSALIDIVKVKTSIINKPVWLPISLKKLVLYYFSYSKAIMSTIIKKF